MTTLLFLPGLAQDDHAYDLLRLEGRTALYPGHGGRTAAPVLLEDIADEIATSLGEQEVDVVGVALGGIIGQYLLIRHPQRVRSAVLANTPSSVGDPAALLSRADEALEAGVVSMTETLVRRWFRPESVASGAPGVAYIRRMLDAMSDDGFAHMQRAMAQTDTVASLSGVAAPVTLVQAADDPVGPGAIMRIGELLPRRRLVRIPGSHMVHLDNPSGLRDVVVDHRRWVDEGAHSTTETDVA